MQHSKPFTFRVGNLLKLLAIPAYLLGWIIAWVVPRSSERWAFGSAIGPYEGALAVADELRATDQNVQIVWLVGSDSEAQTAEDLGYRAVSRASLRGFWVTLRSRFLVVTHGLGDVNRFGIFGGTVVNLWHGPPLKRIHFDSKVTTEIRGPSWLRALLKRMYRSGTARLSLVAAGSIDAAERLRSAFRVLPGIVQVTGDPRLDQLAIQLANKDQALAVRRRVTDALEIDPEHEHRPLMLYAPTWREGDVDPAVPDADTRERIRAWAKRQRVHLVVRSHPLGQGQYSDLVADHGWVHELPFSLLPDLSNVLSVFETVITDYSSLALDFALTERPIIWFAPDLDDYAASRGLYEPYDATTEGHWVTNWNEVTVRVDELLQHRSGAYRAAVMRTKRLKARFHAHATGGAAARVLNVINDIVTADSWAAEEPSVFFESFYGRLATCNPAAIDLEIQHRHPTLRRLWSIESERVNAPAGSIALLVGSARWHAARRQSQLIVVNDWLRFGFKRAKGQTVLQTWHGTPLKRLALDRKGTTWRTRTAIRRESRRWSILLSQNPHSSQTLSRCYAFDGPVIETGYPRNDRLANAVVGDIRITQTQRTAREKLGMPHARHVILYAPTWRDGVHQNIDLLDVQALQRDLGDEWLVLARGHSRVSMYEGFAGNEDGVRDVTRIPDVNDLILAADVFVTDYSSLMFDVSVARIPTLFFVPDLDAYRDDDRGFTLPFESTAPGPLVSDRAALVTHLEQMRDNKFQMIDPHDRAQKWHSKYNPHDDGNAAERVVTELERRGALPVQA